MNLTSSWPAVRAGHPERYQITSEVQALRLDGRVMALPLRRTPRPAMTSWGQMRARGRILSGRATSAAEW